MAGVKWSGDAHGQYGRRVCYPIYRADSKKRGVNLRSYEAGVTPKSVVDLPVEDECKLAWYNQMRRKSDTLVLVEDQVSAIRVSQDFHAAALLGTNLSSTMLEEIKAQGYKAVILCLDNDATNVSIATVLRYRHTLEELQLRGLTTDVKDMTPEQYESFKERLEWKKN